jgi:hypothetical protein
MFICLFQPQPQKTFGVYQIGKNCGTKGNKILQNIKTKWISMIDLVKHVLFEYRTFLMKMALDAPTIASTKSNLCLLTNVKHCWG